MQVKSDLDVDGKVLLTCILSKLEHHHLANYSHLPDDFAYRVKEKCIYQLYGPRSKWFFGLRPWAEAYTASDPMNVCVVEASVANKYSRTFCAPGVCRRIAAEPKPGAAPDTPVPKLLLRLVLATDAGFCKPPLASGQIMTLTAFDSNDNTVILAFAHVPIENADHWTWFLEQFRDAFPRLAAADVVCLADQDKGMAPSLAAVLPTWFRRVCVRHVEPHVVAKGTKHVKKLFWAVAKAWRQEYAALPLEELLQNFPDCHKHVTCAAYTGSDNLPKSGVTLDMWTNAWSSRANWGKIASQGAESTNNAILPFRYMPIPFMIEAMAGYIHERVDSLGKASLASEVHQIVAGNIKKVLDDSIREGRELLVRAGSLVGRSGEVESRSQPGTFHRVELDDGSFCCNRFTVTGVPCRHMCRLASHLRTPLGAAGLVKVELRAATGRDMYQYALPCIPVATVGLVRNDVLLPPDEAKPKGRPPKRRIPSVGESNGKRPNKCRRCQAMGHNKRSCKAVLSSQQQQHD